METTFHNVTITIDAANPTEAYRKLCELFETIKGAEYATDTFTTDNAPDRHRNTSTLWPNQHAGCRCAECNELIKEDADGESTFCGSMHAACRKNHNAHCEPCAHG